MLKFLYTTSIGRMLLKGLTNPKLSVVAGKFLDSKQSKPLIKTFIKTYHIDTDNIITPENGFESFNQFFCRKRRQDLVERKDDELVSPCDGFLTVFDINEQSLFQIKNSQYSVRSLLCDKNLSDEFVGGKALIFRLTPANYHRYNFIDDGTIISHKRIDGILHTVQPIAVENTTVFIQNSREYTVIQSSRLDKYVQMEIGAMLVGRIVNLVKEGNVSFGQEKGYFEYGGSTIVMLFKKDSISIDQQILDQLKVEPEVPIKQFSKIAKVL